MDLHVLRSISKRTCENGVQDMVDTDDPRSSQSEAAGGTDNCSCSNPHRTFFDPQAAVFADYPSGPGPHMCYSPRH